MCNEKRRTNLTKAAWMLATALTVALPQAASAETVLRIGMTAADIPRTLGQPDQGFEGNRFTGIPLFDSLTRLIQAQPESSGTSRVPAATSEG